MARGAFIAFVAKDAVEFGFAFYPSVSAWGAMAALSISIWKNENFFMVREHFEEFIEKSKTKNN